MVAIVETLNCTGIYHETNLGLFFLQNMFIIMSVILFVFIIALVFNISDIRKHLSGIEKKTLIILFLILLFGFFLRNSEYMYGYGLDGIHYTESARTWLHTGMFMKGCAIGDMDSCRLYHQVLFPAGFPYMILLLYMSFGVNTLNVMAFTGIVSSLTIILVFYITRLLFEKDDIGLYSALVFSLIPVDILIAGTGAARSVSLFFMGLTVLFFLIALKNDKLLNWMLVSVTLSLSIYIRQENSLLLIPLSFFLIKKYRASIKGFITSSRFIISAALLGITQIPVQHFVLFSGGLSTHGIPEFSLSYIPLHLPMMLSGLFVPFNGVAIFSSVTTILFLSSAVFLFRKEIKNAGFLWVWFLSFFVLYILYFYCPTLLCGEHVRYMSSLSIPYSILAGFSVFWIAEHFKIKKEYCFVIAFLALFITSGIAMPTSLFRDSRLDEPRLGDQLSAIAGTPPECTVIIPINYMATGSDVLDARRRWIDEMANSEYEDLALIEAKEAECMVFVYASGLNETLIAEKNRFISRHINLEFYFNQNTIDVYNATLKEAP